MPDWGAALAAALVASRETPGSPGSIGSGDLVTAEMLDSRLNSSAGPSGFHPVPAVPRRDCGAEKSEGGTDGTGWNPQARSPMTQAKMAEIHRPYHRGTGGTAGTSQTNDELPLRNINESLAAPASPWSDAVDERAAIVEQDAGAPRECRLDPEQAPGDVPLKRWRRFVDDCGRFLDGGWAARAAALGWGPRDLFGCDRARPFARIDHAGLLWLLNGDRLVMLAPDAAVIETKSRARLTYRRRPIAYDRVILVWELDEHHG